jgi:hypothetical protein
LTFPFKRLQNIIFTLRHQKSYRKTLNRQEFNFQCSYEDKAQDFLIHGENLSYIYVPVKDGQIVDVDLGDVIALGYKLTLGLFCRMGNLLALSKVEGLAHADLFIIPASPRHCQAPQGPRQSKTIDKK